MRRCGPAVDHPSADPSAHPSARRHAFADDALGDHDAVALRRLLVAGEVSAAELRTTAVARAHAVAHGLGAVAHAAYDAPRPGDPDAPLAGVPTFVKDNTDVRAMPTQHGSEAYRARPARRDGAYAAHLLGTGLTVLGKSRLPEFGFNASTEFMTGPPARNPWDPTRSVGASSGGAAALVAAGVVPVAHANDGGGSIRIPAACAGLVGLKPTRGRHVDGEQARALPIRMVSEGVVTRSVRDTAAYVAAVERTWRTARFADDFVQYWALLAELALDTARLTLDRGFDATRADGLSLGLRRHHRRYAHRTPAALRRLRAVPRVVAAARERHDIVLSPVLAHVTPPLGHLSPTVPFDTLIDRLRTYAAYTPLDNIAGNPAISLPMGATAAGLPVGVQLSAAPGDERTLLELAYLLEAAQPFRRIQDAP